MLCLIKKQDNNVRKPIHGTFTKLTTGKLVALVYQLKQSAAN